MKEKILIIEDDRDDFYLLKNLLEQNYDILPNDFNDFPGSKDITMVTEFARKLIKNNYRELRLVLCDIKLGDDYKGGNKVVKRIRNYQEIAPSYISLLPIIAITNYPERQEAIIDSGADFSFSKKQINEEKVLFETIIETQINKFDKNLILLNILKNEKQIFIVHGHAEVEEKVALFLVKLGLSPIILHEQPDDGNTVIEKIENYANVGYAIVLYTPCDEGKAKEEDSYKPRARQNVVFEHGYMTAKLGRENVCVLQEPGVESPGDISGLVYVSLDDSGAWKLQLAKNMKKRGFDIDFNKVY